MQTISACRADADAFEKTYRGRLSDPATDGAMLAQAFDAYEAIFQRLDKVAMYASLVFAADTADPKHGAFMQRMNTEHESVSQKLIFFALELMDVPDEVFRGRMDDPALAKRRYFLSNLLTQKPHRLSEVEEKILSEKALTGSLAFERLFEQELSAKRFTVEGFPETLNESEALHLIHHPDREVRRCAAEGFTAGLREEQSRYTFILNMLVRDKSVDDRYRKFADPESARHLSNRITRTSVDALSQAVGERYGIVRDFYAFKRELLGYDELFDYDRYAPITNLTAPIPFAEGKRIVLDAFRAFDQTFADTAEKFFDGGWIDAGPRPGKRGGAFCSFVTPDVHPYVFLNYQQTARDVETMAHELGHGVHSYLARGQTYLDFHPPLTVCETASIFGEMLVFEALKERLKDDPRALLALYIQKIEETFASTFRQISMYRFEQDLHNAAHEKGELQTEEISRLWRARQEEMFGGSVTLTANYDLWWSYVHHFFEMPFYVYAYAFGELLSLSVYALYKQEGEKILGAYRSFLQSGGSKSPEELVQPFGIDVNDPAFWQQGLAIIDEMVKEAKRLHALTRA